MESKQVPIYARMFGKEVKVGMAIINDDGSIEAKIADDYWKTISSISIGAFSITPSA